MIKQNIGYVLEMEGGKDTAEVRSKEILLILIEKMQILGETGPTKNLSGDPWAEGSTI